MINLDYELEWWETDEDKLPAADCQNCQHQEPLEVGWCYMFEERPKNGCAQFTPIMRQD